MYLIALMDFERLREKLPIMIYNDDRYKQTCLSLINPFTALNKILIISNGLLMVIILLLSQYLYIPQKKNHLFLLIIDTLLFSNSQII